MKPGIEPGRFPGRAIASSHARLLSSDGSDERKDGEAEADEQGARRTAGAGGVHDGGDPPLQMR